MTGGLALGNEKADQLLTPLWASVSPVIDKFGQRAHEFFLQRAKVLHKQFGISLQDAQGIVTTCPQCQGTIGRVCPGVSPHSLGPLQLWQSDVTIYASFGHFRCIHVIIDTFSAMVWATPMTSEGSHFVIRHLQGCFAIMGLPQEIKIDNGSGYTARQTQDFLARWGGKHSTGIPGNSRGQAIVERTHQVLKGLLDKQKIGEDGLSSQDRVLKAVYLMNLLRLVGTRSDPPA